MAILVTGGAGYIGSHAALETIARGTRAPRSRVLTETLSGH